MSGTQRKFKRIQEKEAQNGELTEAQKRLPSGRIVTTPMKGKFLTLPLLGWCSLRKKEEVPLVILGLALLKDNQMKGVLHIELPVYMGETAAATVAALERFGWDGNLWKKGSDSWPTGDPANEEQLLTMMKTTGLVASLTFPPDDTGTVMAQEVEVLRAKGDFLMPPLPQPEPESVDPGKLEKLHELCTNVSQFYPSN